MVNSVTPVLFERYPDAGRRSRAANPAVVEEIVHATGFFRQKTKSLIGMATAVRDRFDGEVPTELDDLVTLPGVGRKTGNVLRSVAYDLPGLPVDTHVGRLATPAEAHHRDGSGEGRARPERARAARGARARSRCG